MYNKITRTLSISEKQNIAIRQIQVVMFDLDESLLRSQLELLSEYGKPNSSFSVNDFVDKWFEQFGRDLAA